MINDVKYAARRLAKSPGFTAVAALALALGIGANTAIFSAVNAVLLRPLRYEEPERLVWLSERSEQLDDMSISLLNFYDWRDGNRVFSDIGIVRGQGATLAAASAGGDAPERLDSYLVSSGYFRALGVRPLHGRAFLPEEDEAGAARGAVVNHRLWRARFGSDPGLVGRTLRIDGIPTTVVGVMPPGFEEDEVDLYVPLGPYLDQLPQERGNHPGFYGVARLRPGVTLEAARADMDAIARRLEEQYPDSNEGTRVSVSSLTDVVVGDVRPALLILLGAVGLVLLIACANVANLLLARAEARSREIAIRTSLGAGRGRLVRQLLTESVLLGLLGGALGLALAVWAVDALVTVNPGNIPRIEEIGVDFRVLGFAFVISLLTGVLFGLAPALKASRPDLNASLKEGSTGVVGGFRRQGLRGALVVSQVALTLVLLAGAGLLMKSFRQLQAVDPGFSAEGVLTMSVAPPEESPEPERWRGFYGELVQATASLPGVRTAAISSALPFEGGGSESGVVIEGRPFPEGPEEATLVQWQTVSPGFFDALGVGLVRGRGFTEADGASAVPVAIVDETLVEKMLPGEDPIGKRVAFEFEGESPADPKPIWREIVGVVRHTRHYGLTGVSRVQIYAPYGQTPIWLQLGRPQYLIARSDAKPEALASAIREEVRRISPDVPVSNVQTMEQVAASQLAQPRFSSLVLGAFAGLALTLAAVGIYGLVAYSVSRRTREIGVRIALGAGRADVVRMVVAQGMALTGLGLAAGMAAAVALSRVLRSLLYEVSAHDPAIFAGVALVVGAVALVATCIPALQATKVDPLVALRYE